jgi:hypothetical protein
MSNQCDILNCDAKNRVIGGSLLSPSARYTVSHAPPIRQAVFNDIDLRTGGKSTSAKILSIHRQQFTGSP